MFNIVLVGGEDSYCIPVERSIPFEYRIQEIYKESDGLDETIKNAGIIIFTGGEDVGPALYGHTAHRSTMFNNRRDIFESQVFSLAKSYKRKMIGICRGSQFLWVMCGGTLIQNMDNHAGGKHSVLDIRRMVTTNVNSTHHQSAYIISKPSDVDILAVSDPSISTFKTVFDKDSDKFIDFTGPEVEAWRTPKKGILGIQWHPEMDNCPVDGMMLSSRYISELIGGV